MSDSSALSYSMESASRGLGFVSMVSLSSLLKSSSIVIPLAVLAVVRTGTV